MPLHLQGYGEGRPIVVLPSFTLTHEAMAAVFEPVFAASPGWRRLYVDLPGTGGSPAGDPRSDVVLDEVVATVEATLGDQPFLAAGWSYGAYIAAGLTRRQPQRVSGLLMACSGFRVRPKDRNLAGVLSSAPEQDWLAGVPENLRGHFTHAIGRQTADVAQQVTSVMLTNGPTDEAYLTELHTHGFALSDEDEPTRCDAPVALLAGRRDRVAGFKDLLGAAQGFSRADCLVVGNAGHYLPVECPGIFGAALLSWLDECRAFAEAASEA